MSTYKSEKYTLEILTPSNYRNWNDFVGTHPFGWLTHLSHWKDAVENCFPNIKGLYFILREKSEIVAGLPIYIVKSWLMGDRLISIPFATISDPLVSDVHQSELLIQYALKYASEQKIRNIQIRSLEAAPYLNEIKIPVSTDDSYKLHYLYLDKSLDELKLSFNKRNVRKRIRQAEEKGLKHRIALDRTELEDFYDIYLETKKRLGLPPLPFKFLSDLWDKFMASGNMNLILAQSKGQTVGGILFFKYKNRANAEIIAYKKTYRELYLSQFLYWQAIIFAREQNCYIFDLGRTSIFNKGLMNYKKHWGTEIRDISFYNFSTSGTAKLQSQEKSVMYNVTRTLSKRLPKPLFRLYGNLFYRHSA